MYFIKIFILGIITLYKGLIYFIKYFFIGLFNIITIIPKYILKIINKKKMVTSNNNDKLSWLILGMSFSVYLICVFLASKWYVQSLKIKYLSEDIINSTEIIEKEEDNLPNNNTNSITNDEPTNDDTEDDREDIPNDENIVYYPNDYWDYLSVPFMDVNFNELIEKNNDTVGWIKVEGTKVNYPVVQTNNNDYYLTHAFNKSDNIGGWIFADYRVNFEDFGKNTIIYGHNMNNKTMFGSISSMLKESYLNSSEENYIKISTPTSNSVWKLFSIYTIEPEVYYLKTNFKDVPFDIFLNTLKDRSIYDFNTNVSLDDKIITLSTCDDTGTKRIAVHAKMISIEYK